MKTKEKAFLIVHKINCLDTFTLIHPQNNTIVKKPYEYFKEKGRYLNKICSIVEKILKQCSFFEYWCRYFIQHLEDYSKKTIGQYANDPPNTKLYQQWFEEPYSDAFFRYVGPFTRFEHFLIHFIAKHNISY